MLYLMRGLRRRNRNDFILAGIFLGLGLHGYSPFRIVPLLVIAAFGLYAVHAQSHGARRSAALWLVIVGMVSLIIFLPLLRYATQHPDSFNYRAMTRLAGVEQPLAAPWYQVFLSNTWNALTMFNWNNGGIWVHSHSGSAGDGCGHGRAVPVRRGAAAGPLRASSGTGRTSSC